jgi:WD40 repeat protein
MDPRRIPAVLFAGLALALIAPGRGLAAEPLAATDLYGDPLPFRASARLGTVRWRAQHGIGQMAFVPGGRYLATTDGFVLSVWDAETGRLVRTLSTNDSKWPAGFQAFAFTPDGKHLLSAYNLPSTTPGAVRDRKSRLRLWEFSSGKVLMQSDLDGAVTSLALRADGRMAAYAKYPGGDIFLWDIAKNVERRVVSRDRRTLLKSLSFAGEGKHLVVLTSEYLSPDTGASQRIDIASGKLLKQTDLGDWGRVALASGEGAIATYSYPDLLCLYDTSTGEKRRLPLKEKVDFLDLSFSPDGRTLLAMDRDAEVVQFWDVAKGRLLRQVRVPGLGWTDDQQELLLSGDGEKLATLEEGVVRLWDARTGEPQLDLPGHVRPPLLLAFSTDGKEVVSCAYRYHSDKGQLYRWDLATMKPRASLSSAGPGNRSSYSDADSRLAPGGQLLAERVGADINLYEGSKPRRIVQTGNAPSHSDWTFTPDGRALVTTGANQEIRMWDVTSGKLLRQLELGKKDGPIAWLGLIPDGRTLATGEGWRKVHLWDAATGKHRATLTLPAEREPHQKPLYRWQTAFTPDGRYLFASNTTNLWVWDLVARREIGPFEEDEHRVHLGASGQVAVSPDGRLMAWFDPAWDLRLYEVCTGKIVYRFKERYSSIAFAPSGWRLATGCDADSSVLIWDLPQLFHSEVPAGKNTRPEALWSVLKAGDTVQAYGALWRLVALTEADTFLASHLQPVESVPPERLRALLADLGSPNFDRRERADQALAAAGEAVRAALAEAFAGTEDPEVRRRLAELQERLQPRAGERLREVRAILVLEARGTVEARRLLLRLAAGLSEARLTQEAKKALERLPR